MKFIKRNLKLFIGFLIGTVLAGGIVYAATTNAKDVTYTTSKNAEISNVADALNDLYKKQIPHKKQTFYLIMNTCHNGNDWCGGGIKIEISNYSTVTLDLSKKTITGNNPICERFDMNIIDKTSNSTILNYQNSSNFNEIKQQQLNPEHIYEIEAWGWIKETTDWGRVEVPLIFE